MTREEAMRQAHPGGGTMSNTPSRRTGLTADQTQAVPDPDAPRLPSPDPWARITRTRFGYEIRGGSDGCDWSGYWWRPTRASAERTARALVRRSRRDAERRAESWYIR